LSPQPQGVAEQLTPMPVVGDEAMRTPPAAQLARAPAMRPAGLPKRQHVHRATRHAKPKSEFVAQHKKGASPWSANQITPINFTRRRSEVRGEYIASREQVAALTSEDSGSAYLARLAARQRAARSNGAEHVHGRTHASRGSPARF
jgi:hypothetical protein